MTIIHPRQSRRSKTNPAIIIGLLCIIALTGVNAIVYTKTVAVEHDAETSRELLETARAENTDLKNSWYEAVNGANMERLVE